MVTAIVGANWGDEGKGKITDMLAEQSDVVIRFQGGANAGHTIINNYGRFALHILPSGIFYPHITNIIGNGVALDIQKLANELDDIVGRGVPAPNLIVSERAQLLMPYHVLQDTYEEARLGGKAFGSPRAASPPSTPTSTPRRASRCATCSTPTASGTGSPPPWPSRTCSSSTCTTSPPWRWMT